MESPRQAESGSFNTNFFCLKLANNILLKKAAEDGSNTVISPFSFHLILSMIAAGSAGRTLEQLFRCLGSTSLEEMNSSASRMIDLALPVIDGRNGSAIGDPDLSFANGAWVAEGLKLKPYFQEILAGLYHAVAKEVDFANKAEQVVAEVNAWAETATRGLIKNLLTTEALEALTDNTALILANALYFKGTWAQLFDTSRTKTRVFHLSDGHKVHVPFMTSLGFQRYLYRSFAEFKILKLPYKSHHPAREFAMYFFLPDARDGLKDLLEMFKANPEYLNIRFDLVEEKIPDFWIPRFRFEFELEASEAMIQMGLDLPFDRMKAELTGMVYGSTGRRLFVKKVFHKCLIEVNEEGTEAAASTAVIIEMQQMQSMYPIASFVANHPFMFMIREDISGVVFFVGSVLNPLLNN